MNKLLDLFNKEEMFQIYRRANALSEEGLPMYKKERFRKELKIIVNEKIDKVLKNESTTSPKMDS